MRIDALDGRSGALLGMQKVEGSNPFSRFEEAPLRRGFLRLGVGQAEVAQARPGGSVPDNVLESSGTRTRVAGGPSFDSAAAATNMLARR